LTATLLIVNKNGPAPVLVPDYLYEENRLFKKSVDRSRRTFFSSFLNSAVCKNLQIIYKSNKNKKNGFQI